MRRKDREMGKAFALDVIDRSDYGVLSLLNREEVYSIPLSLVRRDDCLYFHGAKEGTKAALFVTRPQATCVFVQDVRVPRIYSEDELRSLCEDPRRASLLISKVFTTEYASAIVQGPLSLLEDPMEKIQALRWICEKYTPDQMAYFEAAIHAGLERTNVYRIHMKQITAKRKKYDTSGEEMKWERMK